MELPGHLDVIVLASWAVADVFEIEPDYVVCVRLGGNFTAVDFHGFAVFTGLNRQSIETFSQADICIFIKRRVEQFRLLESPQPVVYAAINVDHIGVLFDELNSGQEPGALETILVETIRDDVGGTHQGDAATE